MGDLPTGTVTFLFADIEGSTRLLEQLGDGYAAVLAECRQLLRVTFQTKGGQEVDTQGDAMFVAFPRARDAAAAAVIAQRAIMTHSWTEGVTVRVRMGLHTGEPLSAEIGYVGLDVHRAARICAAGHGGQILLSNATRALIEEDLLPEVGLRDLGEHRLKDLTRPERLFQVIAVDLPAEFPRLKTLDLRPHNLPVQPTQLIGREHEAQAVKESLHRSEVRLLTLVGAPGIGKTRLSLQVAADAVEEFVDGVFFVALAPIIDPRLVIPTIAQTLGLKEAGGRPLLEGLKDFLRDKRLLLVLDNFEQVLAAAPMVADLLAGCTSLKVLATSRAPLHVRGEYEFQVPPLTLPDLQRLPPVETLSQYAAVRLFVERAQGVKPGFALHSDNAPAVAEICHRLDGLPLAIELAAARVKLLPPQAMRKRLEHRLQLLMGGPRDLPARHQTVREAIAWSYNLMEENEQALFRRLGVFVGGCTLEAVEAVCDGAGLPGMDVLNGVASLVDKSLLREEEAGGGEPRFTMLETIREYALELLETSGEAPATRRHHTEYYLALAVEAEPKLRSTAQEVWIPRLEAEHDNLRAALAWSLAGGNGGSRGTERPSGDGAHLGLRLVGALWWFWFVGGHFSEGRRWLEQALATSEGAPASMRARALLGEGVQAFMLGDFKGGVTLLEDSLRLSRASQDRKGVAWAIGWLGIPPLYAGDNERALACCDESLALLRELGDKWGIAWMTMGRGQLLILRGNVERGGAILEEGLALCREVGDRWLTALTLHNSANAALARGDLERATPLIEESLVLFRELRDRRSIARALGNLGRLTLARDDLGRATALFQESLRLFREIGDRRGIALSLERLASTARINEQLQRAVRLFGAADILRESIGIARAGSGRAVYEFGPVDDLMALHLELGDEAFGARWAEGRAMTLGQAIAYALSAEEA